MNSSYWWGKTETALNWLFCVLWKLEWIYTGLCGAVGRTPTLQSRLPHEVLRQDKGGGIWFSAYSGWFNDVTVIQQYCSPHLDSNAHPFSNFSISLETSLPTWKRCKQTQNRTPRKQQDQAQCLHPPWSPVLIRDMSCASLLPQDLSFLFHFLKKGITNRPVALTSVVMKSLTVWYYHI